MTLVCLAAVYIIWGTSYLAIRFGLESWPPLMMAGVRHGLAGVMLLTILLAQGRALPTWRQWGGALVMGTLMLACGNGMVVLAERTVTSAMTAITIASVGLWVALIGAAVGRHPRRGEWMGVALGMAGVLLLHADEHLQAHPLGATFLTLACISWACGSHISHRLHLARGLMSSASQMLCSGLVLLSLSRLQGETLTAWPTPRSWAALLYLTVFGSLIGYSAFSYLLAHVRPVLATSYAYVNPVVAVVVGAVIGHETISRQALLALGVILAGVGLIARHSGKE